MIAIPLLAALLLSALQDAAVPVNSAPATAASAAQTPSMMAAPKQFTAEQQEQIKQKLEQATIQWEAARKQAVRINDLAADIHSEADARKLVDAVAEVLTNHQHLLWAGLSYRHRVARAEFEAVSDPAHLIPEQRIVDVWNEYVREIDAPEEALVTLAELHNLRDGMYVGASRFAWKREGQQSIWTMPNIYAVDDDGKIANGCRALEALKVIHDMHDTFMNVRIARARVEKGILSSELWAQRERGPAQAHAAVFSAGELRAFNTHSEVMRMATYHYQQEHGEQAYDRLVQRLFNELFPVE